MYKSTLLLVLMVTFAAVTLSSAVPKPGDSLSDAKHYDGDEHNTQYDHEAFLGKDEAKTFDQLTPEESQRRLGVIVDKIDANNDSFVDLAELKNWIQFTQRRYIDEDVDRQWRQHNKNNEDFVQWENYRKTVYGFMDEMDPKDLENQSEGFSYKSMLIRDRRRWSFADRNGDDNLNRTEFTDFLHPEESPRMRDIVVTETLEDIDKDHDGKLSVDEYIGDMFRPTEDGEDEPEWVVNERETFGKFRDKDSDGFLDKDEVRDWITPPDFDHAEAEAKHLIYEADSDADEKLSKDEIMEKYDVFVGSQATDFGEAFNRHDEF